MILARTAPVTLSFRLAALLVPLLLPASAQAQTLEQMAGQMIVVGFQGDEADDAAVADLRDDLAAGRLGGVMLLKINVKSLDAVAEMNAAFRAASPDLPPLRPTDERPRAAAAFEMRAAFSLLAPSSRSSS